MADVKYRNFTQDDIPDIVQVANAIATSEGEEGDITPEMLSGMLQIPFVHPEEDFFIYLDNDDTVIGASISMVHPRIGRAQAHYLLHPDFPEAVYKPKMIELALDRVKARMENVPDDKTIYVDSAFRDGKVYDRELLEQLGFSEVRRFYEMRIALDTPLEAPTLPDGLEFRPYTSDQLKQVHSAHQEAFRDHWGHAEDTPFEEWAPRVETMYVDPEKWWFLLWDVEQNEIAGYSLCTVDRAKDNMMEINLLGVRRPWRKRGLGMILLQHSFHQFQQDGFTRAHLGVDATSKTNAVALYERAGMYQHECTVILRKVLRGDPANIVE